MIVGRELPLWSLYIERGCFRPFDGCCIQVLLEMKGEFGRQSGRLGDLLAATTSNRCQDRRHDESLAGDMKVNQSLSDQLGAIVAQGKRRTTPEESARAQ